MRVDHLVQGFLADMAAGANPYDHVIIHNPDTEDQYHIATRGYDPDANNGNGAIVLTIGDVIL